MTRNCDDNNPCTVDSCIGNGCANALGGTCNDNNPCTVDTCDPASGCAYNAPNGTCSVASDCPFGGACIGKMCVCGGATLCNTNASCVGQNALGIGTCAAVCDDGNPCTINDLCTAGLCKSGTANTCDDGNSCTVDSCNSFGCAHAAPSYTCQVAADCAEGGYCAQGTCACNGTTKCATGATCNMNGPASVIGLGTCMPTCSDNNVCTANDTCYQGTCQAGVAGSTISCDDQNPCTVDSCDPITGCAHTTAGACNDNNVCTTDTCLPGLGCVNTALNVTCNSQADCVSGGTCTSGYCECSLNTDCAANATCVFQNAAFGVCVASCDDGNACTTPDGCNGGKCQSDGTKNCDDANACTADSCIPSDGSCVHNPIGGAACDDGNPCTGGDSCVLTLDVTGIVTGSTCHAGTGNGCDDNNPCTTDSCLTLLPPFSISKCQNVAVADGNNCSTCFTGTTGLSSEFGTCFGGTCLGNGLVSSCDDGNPLTTDTCVSASNSPIEGCVHTPN